MTAEFTSSYERAMAAKPTDRPNVRLAVPCFNVRDIEASLRFYIEGLGFRLARHWTPEKRIRWCWLELDNVALMLQERSKAVSPGGGLAASGQRVAICFMCADAIEIHHAAKARGLAPSTPVVANHRWVTAFTDPDGYSLTFESPADLPEGTEYSLVAESYQGG